MKISAIIVVIMTGGGILLSTPPPPQLKLQVAVPLGYRLASAQRNQSPLHWARRVAMRKEWERLRLLGLLGLGLSYGCGCETVFLNVFQVKGLGFDDDCSLGLGP